MKNLVVIILFAALVSFPALSQESKDQEFEDQEDFREMVIKTLPVQATTLGKEEGQYVKVLMVGAANFAPSNAAWAILDFASEYYSSDVWNMVIVAANYSDQPVSIKVEFELRWKEGASKIYKKWSRTIQAGYVMMYTTPITTQIKQKGLFTLYGRVSGLGLGNHNEVVTQLYIY